MSRRDAESLLEFINESPTCFQAVQALAKRLEAEGFGRLYENGDWRLRTGGRYYTVRNGSSLIAFTVPEHIDNFQITASHSDSPTFKIKEIAELKGGDRYIRLNTEKYGGMIMSTWLDRPLSVAGRLTVREKTGIRIVPVTVDQDLLVIPNLAIHMNRKINDGYSYNPQKDMIPLFGPGTAGGTFMETVAEAAGIDVGDIIDHDLFLYNRMPGSIWGPEGDYVSASRLDDLGCVHACLQGFLRAADQFVAEQWTQVPVFAVFNNEETGSQTPQGAASDFMRRVMMRICDAANMNREETERALAVSYMISADNAQAAHPNHMEKSDDVNRPFMNEGIVIKYNAAGHYTSDAVSASIFKMVCENAGVPYQVYVNRSDVAGGSTLGNIANTQVSMHTVDIGLAQLAMHSSWETMGTEDLTSMICAVEVFYKNSIRIIDDEQILIG